MTAPIRKLATVLRRESTRRWLYGIVGACLYAAAGYGLIDGEQLMMLLAIPAAVLDLARLNVRNPE